MAWPISPPASRPPPSCGFERSCEWCRNRCLTWCNSPSPAGRHRIAPAFGLVLLHAAVGARVVTRLPSLWRTPRLRARGDRGLGSRAAPGLAVRSGTTLATSSLVWAVGPSERVDRDRHGAGARAGPRRRHDCLRCSWRSSRRRSPVPAAGVCHRGQGNPHRHSIRTPGCEPAGRAAERPYAALDDRGDAVAGQCRHRESAEETADVRIVPSWSGLVLTYVIAQRPPWNPAAATAG